MEEIMTEFFYDCWWEVMSWGVMIGVVLAMYLI